MIYGKSGTGKELVARAIHRAGPRAERAFIRVNCGALAEGVLESELFGHEKGAFTHAIRLKKGRFELADGGTLFLDEVGDLPPALQVKLLRVLQEKEFERVGGEETLRTDVRVIAATNRDLEKLVKQGDFREDLFYRLHIIPVYLPPLQDRSGDIPLLTRFFLDRLGKKIGNPDLTLTKSALDVLCSYHWPGNVRELENILERAAVLNEESCIDVSDLPVGKSQFSSQPKGGLNEILARVEKESIEQALRKAGGVKTKAAQLLKIKTSALYYKLEKYDLM
jgi:transcriptional regulator with GAF, ATPase, and Fis domain